MMAHFNFWVFNYNFFKEILSGSNRKTEGTFIDSRSKPVCWMNLKGTKRDKSSKNVEWSLWREIKIISYTVRR